MTQLPTLGRRGRDRMVFRFTANCAISRGGFRGGVRGVRPPKIRKAYVIQR